MKLTTSHADPRQLAYVGKQPGVIRDSNEWYTPAEYIEAARTVMDGIDFDPFSSEEANKTVRAGNYFSMITDALKAQWPIHHRTIFMNPPYGAGVINRAIDRFISELPHCKAAIVLVNNATETAWFQALASECNAMCLVAKRIAFISPDGKAVSGNTRGQVFFYFGNREWRFQGEFAKFGLIAQVS